MSALAFEYRAMDRAGRTQRGVARAASRDEAYRQVAAGLTPLAVRPIAEKGARRGRRIRKRDVAQFTQQLSVLLQARIPISEALAGVAEEEPNPRLRAVLTDVAARVQAGESVASSLDRHRRLFGGVYVETLHAAERSGAMVRVLEHLAGALERAEESARQVRGAMMYPLVVVGTLGLATLFLLGFVVPRFARLFEARGVELPFLTRLLMTVGTSLQTYWWAYLGTVVVLTLGTRRALRSPVFRERVDHALHRIPVLSGILRGLAVSRFARVLGLSLSAGLGLLEALQLSARASGRPLLLADARRLGEQVRAGGRLADGLSACAYVPLLARRLLSAGEKSGELGRMCEAVATHYERESSHLMKNIGTAIEPVLVVLIAGVVAVVALAIFLPMWNMVTLMGG